MSWIPGWDSIAGTGFWSGFYFWVSIGGLILLGIAEVASHRYADRREQLVDEQRIAEKKQHDDEIAHLHLQAAQLNKEAEELRHQNLELEHAVAPRMLDQGTPAKTLKQFAGTEVLLLSAPDFEARRFSAQFPILFQLAGWRLVEGTPASFPMQDGVAVSFVSNAAFRTPAEERRSAAAEALVAELQKQQIDARISRAKPGFTMGLRPAGISDDVIIVAVGAKPVQWFLEQKFPQIKEMRERMESPMTPHSQNPLKPD